MIWNKVKNVSLTCEILMMPEISTLKREQNRKKWKNYHDIVMQTWKEKKNQKMRKKSWIYVLWMWKVSDGECVQNDEEDRAEDGKIEIYLRLITRWWRQNGITSALSTKINYQIFQLNLENNIPPTWNRSYFYIRLKLITASTSAFHISLFTDIRFHRNVCHRLKQTPTAFTSLNDSSPKSEAFSKET